MNPELSASSIQYSTSFTTLKPPLSMILLSYLAPICMLNLHTRAMESIIGVLHLGPRVVNSTMD